MNKMFFAGVALTLSLVVVLSIFGFASEGFNSEIDSDVALEGSAVENSIEVISDKVAIAGDNVQFNPLNFNSGSNNKKSKSRNSDNGIINKVSPVQSFVNSPVGLEFAFIQNSFYQGESMDFYLNVFGQPVEENRFVVYFWSLNGALGDKCVFYNNGSIDDSQNESGENIYCNYLVPSEVAFGYDADRGVPITEFTLTLSGENLGVGDYFVYAKAVPGDGSYTDTEDHNIKVLGRNLHADVNNDGFVDKTDIEIVKYLIGRAETGKADVNGDGMATFADITEILANWS